MVLYRTMYVQIDFASSLLSYAYFTAVSWHARSCVFMVYAYKETFSLKSHFRWNDDVQLIEVNAEM